MHIQPGTLGTTACALTGAVSLGAVGYCVYRLKDALGDRSVPLTAMMGSLVFAGQMVNFPIGAPVSGHLMGGVLAAIIAGPYAGCLAVALVLIVQCAMFADGGLLELGANTLHMAVVGSLGGYAVYALTKRLFHDERVGTVVGAVVASWLTVMAAAALFCVEFTWSWAGDRPYDFQSIVALMVSFHSLIGIGEALITGSVIAYVLRIQPDLIYSGTNVEAGRVRLGRTVVAGVVCALATAAFLAPFASSAPDGLEAVAQTSGFQESAQTSPALFEDYAIPALERRAGWQQISVSVAGVGGTFAVLMIALVLGRCLKAASGPLPEVPCD
ncbi:MAG: cobalt ABC transporter permease [Planctomycetaceae bacterium]|nr:cobalt ABC transporter permease [Planctomycetaceae bacterium]